MTTQSPTHETSQTSSQDISNMTYEERIAAAALFEEVELDKLRCQNIDNLMHSIHKAEDEYDVLLNDALLERDLRVDHEKAICLRALKTIGEKRRMGLLSLDQVLAEINEALASRDAEIRKIKVDHACLASGAEQDFKERIEEIWDFNRVMATLRKEIRAKKYRDLQLPLPDRFRART